jgi:hypothetical protein
MKRDRFFSPLLVLSGALVLAVTISVFAQTPGQTKGKQTAPAKTTAKKKTKAVIPRTSWGVPDLQGTWFVTEDVPLERSAANANREFLTDEEVAASDKQKGVGPGRNMRNADTAQDVSGAYNAVFNSVLKTGRRTSRVIDPPDGRIPPTVNAAGKGGAKGPGGGAGKGLGAGKGGNAQLAILGIAPGQNDNPETAAQSPRCLGVAMPFLPLNTAFAQGTVLQIVQSPKTVGIYMEDDHAGGGNRVVYLDGKHPPANIKLFLGDSRGFWEGDTLVVETTNFTQGFRGSTAESLKITERLRRTGPNELERRVTFEDPKTWTRPWTVLIDMGKTDDRRHMIFDSACHEGNYGLTGLLVGARREEEQAAKQK